MDNVRMRWIDMMRGFCMVAIIIDHTIIYYAGAENTDYFFFVYQVLAGFFFLSGYLFYREGKEAFDLKQKIHSIFRRLVVPYFLFTSLMAIPKALAHHQELSWNIVTNILNGHASWFVAAMIVSCLLFSLLLKVSGQRLAVISIVAMSCLLFTICQELLTFTFWHWKEAVHFLFFMYVGYLFHRFQNGVTRGIMTPGKGVLAFSLFLLVMSKYLYLQGMIPSHPILFNLYAVMDSLVCIVVLIQLTQWLPKITQIEWIGKKSIIYYFLCGGVPFGVAMMMNKIGVTYSQEIMRLLLAILLTTLILSVFVWVIDRLIMRHL